MSAGILLVNLGSPDAPTPAAVKRYLAEFLWDPRIADVWRPLWWLILNGIILNSRPAKSAAKYAAIWTDAGSPLIHATGRQAAMLAEYLGGEFPVVAAMRYGNPSIAAGIEALMAEGIERILVLPLYPQYSATTTASVFDAVTATARARSHIPELRFVNRYWDEPAWSAAVAASIREYRETHGTGEKLLMSFHGIPRRYAENGDPYAGECRRSATAIAQSLGLSDDEWLLTFQSRFGREEWLRPYTDETIERLAQEGVKAVDVVCPGFAADCLETLEEIAIENRERFLLAGGERFHYIPALNERGDHIATLVGVATRNLAGW